MALAREQYATPDRILSASKKTLLEGFGPGRAGLCWARKARRFFRGWRDPVQRRIWVRDLGLPLRNLFLLSRPLAVSIDGTPVLLAPRGSAAGNIWAGLRRDSCEVSFVLSALRPGMIFFDVGASAGLFSISAAKKIGGKNVFAFEPCPSTGDLLGQNLLLNDVADVNVTQIALGDSTDEGALRVTHPDGNRVRSEHLRVTTIDAFTKEQNIPRVDVMKVDMEGAELLLFRGARELLSRADAPLILYEGFGFLTRGFGYHPVEILWFLESCGYTLFLLNSQTGRISELKPDYQYDAMVIAAKPGHSAYSTLRERSGADSAGSGLPLQPGQSWSPPGNC